MLPPVVVVDARRASELAPQHHQRLVRQQPTFLGGGRLDPCGQVVGQAAQVLVKYEERSFREGQALSPSDW